MLQIERRRTKVDRQKIGELEFTDRKQRTRVYRQKVGEKEFTNKKQKTEVYRQKVGELEFTDKKYGNWSLQIKSRRTGVYRQ